MSFKKLFVFFAVPLAPGCSDASAQDIGKTSFSVQLNQNFEYVDGLAATRLTNNTLFTPRRVSDGRSNTGASINGLYSPDGRSTIDFGYDVALTSYFENTAFNLMTHTVGGGYTYRLDQKNVVSVRGDVGRAFAGTDFGKYYRRAHVAAALAQSYSNQFSTVYGVDLSRLLFDKAGQQDGLLTELSATPSYRFSDAPATLSVVFRYGNNNANANVNSYKTFDVIPTLSYALPDKQFIKASAQWSKANFDGRDTIQTTVTRDDNLYRGGVTYYAPVADTPLTGNLFGYAGYNYTRNDSNISRQDYDSSVFTLGLTTKF